MHNFFCKTPLAEAARTLSLVAGGLQPAETVIQNAHLVNVCTREILPGADVAIALGRIALVGDARHCIGPNTRVIDARGRYLTPGLLDGHVHVESSMLGLGEYARAVLGHGTVGIVMDPHEIANVLGMPGIECMLEDARRTPLKVMLTTPSCVPAMPGFEDAGAALAPEDIARSMARPQVVGLGEMMNFPGILSGAEGPHQMVASTLAAGKIATGHYAALETGQGLNAYAASGIRCCHESTREEDALARMRLGMYAMLREGSGWRDLREVAKSITRHEVDSRFAVLVSDDLHPHTLLAHGHMDHILRRAMEEGIDPMTALQMATLNCAQCFHLDHELGSIAPGRCADLLLVSDLREMDVSLTMIDGEAVFEDGRLTIDIAPYQYPDWARETIRIGRTIDQATFRIPTDAAGPVRVRAIEVASGKIVTRQESIELTARAGRLEADVAQDALKCAVIERHHQTGRTGLGFVKGFGIRCGAMASTVSHDAHNLLVIGCDDRDMAVAANALIACGGGMAVAVDGAVRALVPLPIAGLMGEDSAREMSERVAALETAWRETGCTLTAPFMTMAMLALPCIPALRLTDRGLVDTEKFQFVDIVL